MSLFRGLTEAQIMEKIIQYEKDDYEFELSYGDIKSRAYIKRKCENNGKYVIVVGYLQAEFRYRTADYVPVTERRWCVMDENGICETVHMRFWAARNKIGIRREWKPAPPRVKDEVAMECISQVRSAAFNGSDKGNCVPTAIAAVTGIPYEEVREKAKDYGFNPDKGGMTRGNYQRMLTDMGIKFEIVTKEIREKAKTTKTLDRLNIPGKYLVSVNGHCIGMINGTMLDYSWNENRRIQSVLKIIS